MNKEIIESIVTMNAVGNRLELPKTKMTNYPQVKAVLVKAGGKYVKNGFNFTSDAFVIQNRLCGGEEINDKKKFQFFPTPEPLARKLVEMADIKLHHSVLEPSAGQGAIVKWAQMETENMVTCVELMPENIKELISQDRLVIEGDFLKMGSKDLGRFDRIIANPPFRNHQDIDHVRHMYSLLNKGGRLVSIVSESVQNSQIKPSEFRELLIGVGAKMIPLSKGSFKESGTMVGGYILTIDKVV